MKQRCSNKDRTANIWIKGTTQWMNEWVSKCWKLYYVNFMFEPLHVPSSELVLKMHRGITKFYGRFCTEFVRNGRAESEQKRIPKLWLFPDLPVDKREKTSIREVTINGGLHFNGPLLVPPVSRFKECPIAHIAENQGRYTRYGIKRIHIRSGWDIAGLADYAVKTIKRDSNWEKDILILPRPVADLSAKKIPIVHPMDRMLKDIQSRFNVSDEVAQRMEGALG